MSPLAVMRLTGWVLLGVGLVLLTVGVLASVTTALQHDAFPLLGIVPLVLALLAFGAGGWWAFHSPSEAELLRWARKRR